jgi:hypothetical protein
MIKKKSPFLLYNQWDSGVSRPEHPNEDSVLEPLGAFSGPDPSPRQLVPIYSSIILATPLLIIFF